MGIMFSFVLNEFSFVIMNAADDCQSCHNCRSIEIAIDDTSLCLSATNSCIKIGFSTRSSVVEIASFPSNYESNYSCQFFCRICMQFIDLSVIVGSQCGCQLSMR